MVLLFDTNAVLDYILVRYPQYNDMVQLVGLCHKFKVKSYIAFHSVSIIWYNLRHNVPLSDRRKLLMGVASLFEITSATHPAVVDAMRNENFPDFEDCLQEKCALNVNADYIVTSNVKDFAASKVPAVTLAEMVEIINNS